MTAQEIFDVMVSAGQTTRETIDEFFLLLSSDTLENQIAMTLTPDDSGTEYTTVSDDKIRIVE
jgi:hypothetical protein